MSIVMDTGSEWAKGDMKQSIRFTCFTRRISTIIKSYIRIMTNVNI